MKQQKKGFRTIRPHLSFQCGKRKNANFTLIELLIVIAIISIT